MLKLNPLLVITAALCFAATLGLLFAPDELARAAGAEPTLPSRALLQLLGSAFLGFALLNWTARYSRTDGIYSRPLVTANLGHTMTAALLLVRIAVREPHSTLLIGATAVYAALAIAFGWQLFRRVPAQSSV